jgi:hypothetical protein
MRVLVTGSREWTDHHLIRRELDRLVQRLGEDEQLIVVHGAARGADTIADQEAYKINLRHGEGVISVERYPADWERYGKAAGPIRNTQMLDPRPSLVLAFHEDLESSKGTADMVRKALALCIPVEQVEPDGRRGWVSHL